MSEWWSSLSIKNKLQIPIQLILLVVMVAAQRWAFDRYEMRVLEDAKNRAVIPADGVFNGLNMMMLNGTISDVEQRKLFVKKMTASSNAEELRVVRGKPVQAQFGAGLAEEQPADDLDRAALERGEQQNELSEKNGKRILRVVQPIAASKNFRGTGTNCLQCHVVDDGAVIGAVTVSLDMTGEYAAMNKASAVLWIGQIVVQMLLFFVIGWLINQVTRPTRELQQIMLAMQADGDLSRRVAVHSKDEVGQTAVAFNALDRQFCIHHPASAGRRGQDQQNHQSYRRHLVGGGRQFARAERGGFVHCRGSRRGDRQHQLGGGEHQCGARIVREKPAPDRAGQSQRGGNGA